MWELPDLIDHLDVRSWSWVKVTFIILGVLMSIAVRVKRPLSVHVTLQAIIFFGLVFIFGVGVYERGVLGTSVSKSHGWVYYMVLVPHVICGLLYAYGALRLARLGWLIAVRRKVQYLPDHRSLGRFAARSLYLSVLLALPL